MPNHPTTVLRIRTQFKWLAQRYAGLICAHTYGLENKCVTFTPLAEPKPMDHPCACGGRFWNATNFFNDIHFCDDREYDFMVSSFEAKHP